MNRRIPGKIRAAAMLLIFIAAQTHFSALAQSCPPPPPPPPPAAAGAQHPTLLQGYALRPPFRVAGVDYPVGVPAGTKLTDWQALSGPGITVRADASPPYVRVDDTSNVVISGVDFSLHGGAYLWFKNSPNPTVISSNFGGPNLTLISAGVINTDNWSPNLTVSYSTIDGAGMYVNIGVNGPGGSGLIFNQGGGRNTVIHNWLKNAPEHTLEEVQLPTVPLVVIYRKNLIEQSGWGVASHPNYLQFGSGYISCVDVKYNTFYNTPQASSGESLQFYNNFNGYVHNAHWAYNVMIATGGIPGDARDYVIPGGGDQNSGVGHDNYVDTTAAFGLFYPGSMTSWTLRNNYNMVTGAPD
ncbi:MAG: hypothetical protein ACRD50_17050 [Candidatus Acidiferrales bacterium]